jgi:hypothetical protein
VLGKGMVDVRGRDRGPEGPARVCMARMTH